MESRLHEHNLLAQPPDVPGPCLYRRRIDAPSLTLAAPLPSSPAHSCKVVYPDEEYLLPKSAAEDAAGN